MTLAGCLDDIQFLQATYQFVGSNDDELSFNKGDVIVLTKKDDGGWWEGTLDGKIGWFPSNYCKTISPDPEPEPEELPADEGTEESSSYHHQVVDNIIQTQKRHLDELKGFLDKYLTPLKSSEVLEQQDRETLCGNYDAIVEFHVLLDTTLEEESKKSIPEQRFGKCLLNLRNQMKELYFQYCSNHPQAANLIADNGDELGTYMESLGAASPGIMILTSFLSKPFLHVEKYGNQIKELERHVQENHVDNLDMKKATQVLQIIALSCHETRKKKEMELQMLTGTIDKWEGEPISSLGNLVHMGQVFVEKPDVGRRERYFCIFPNDLVILSVSPELVGYCFEERHLISEISAKNVEDTDNFFNGFVLTVSESAWQVMTSSPREKDAWMDSLKKVLGDKCIEALDIEIKKPASSNLERSDSKRSEVRSLPMLDANSMNDDLIPRSFSTGATVNVKVGNNTRNDAASPTPGQDLGKSLSAVRGSVRQPVRKEWSFTRLRPTPPYQQNAKANEESSVSPKAIRRIASSKNKLMVGGRGSKEDLLDPFARKQSTPAAINVNAGNDERQILEEDMMILSVIEAYCFSARQRQPMNLLRCPGDEVELLSTDVTWKEEGKTTKETKKSFKKRVKDAHTVASSSEDEGTTQRKSTKAEKKDTEKKESFFRKKSQKKNKDKIEKVENNTSEMSVENTLSVDQSFTKDGKISTGNLPKKSQSLKLQKKNSIPLLDSKDNTDDPGFTKDGKFIPKATALKKSQSLKMEKNYAVKPSPEVGSTSPRHRDVEKLMGSSEKLNTRPPVGSTSPKHRGVEKLLGSSEKLSTARSSFRGSLEKLNRRFFNKQDSVEVEKKEKVDVEVVAAVEPAVVFLPDGRLAQGASLPTGINTTAVNIEENKENTITTSSTITTDLMTTLPTNTITTPIISVQTSQKEDGETHEKLTNLKSEANNVEISVSTNDEKVMVPANDAEITAPTNDLEPVTVLTKQEVKVPTNDTKVTLPINEVKATVPVNDTETTVAKNEVKVTVPADATKTTVDKVDGNSLLSQNILLRSSNVINPTNKQKDDIEKSEEIKSPANTLLSSADDDKMDTSPLIANNAGDESVVKLDDVEGSHLLQCDGSGSEDESLIRERKSSFGKNIFLKGCLCYSSKSVMN